MPSFESSKNYVIISCYPLKRLQRYYIFFIWQNVFHSFLFSLSFSSFILSFLPFLFSSFPLFFFILSFLLYSLFSSFPLFFLLFFSLLPLFFNTILWIAHVCVCPHISASARMYIIRSSTT